MTEAPAPPRRYRLQLYLIAIYALFIAYVSLSPFSGFQDQGLSFAEVLTAPLARTYTWFDFTLNCLAYLPLGFLLAYVLLGRLPSIPLLIIATLGGLSLSLAMEYTQLYLPSRVSSNTDLLSNSSGSLLGAALALHLQRFAWFSHIRRWHNHWFKHGRLSDFGLALLAAWMFAQINPSLPMLGSVFVREVARWPFDIVPEAPFNWLESAEVALNLLLLGILLSSLLRERRHILSSLLLVLGSVTLTKFIASTLLLKSRALLLWFNSEALLGILAGLLLLAGVLRLAHNWQTRLGALAALMYLALVLDLLLDSNRSAAMRLYHWQYIHMLNYNGFSQLIILLFPFLLLAYLWRIRMLRK